MKSKKNQDSNSAKRLAYVDILNILAIIAVLFMHHDFGAHYFRPEKSWVFDLILKILAYFCIPVFLMITGSTLLGFRKKYDLKGYFKKRFIKILIPMAAWFIIMPIVRIFVFKDLSVSVNTPFDLISFIMKSGPLDYYWYLFLIIGIYLTIPILSPLSEVKHKQLLRYAIIAIFVFNMVIPNLFSLFGIYYNQDLFVKIGAYLIYPLIGYYISTYNITRRRNRVFLYASGLAAIIYQFIATTALSYSAGESNLVALGYTQFATALYASAIFCFVRNIKCSLLDNTNVQRVLKTIAGCSFGIYLIHYIVMHFETDILRGAGLSSSSAIYRFLCPLLTYALCVGIVLILKKIPLVRRIVP